MANRLKQLSSCYSMFVRLLQALPWSASSASTAPRRDWAPLQVQDVQLSVRKEAWEGSSWEIKNAGVSSPSGAKGPCIATAQRMLFVLSARSLVLRVASVASTSRDPCTQSLNKDVRGEKTSLSTPFCSWLVRLSHLTPSLTT